MKYRDEVKMMEADGWVHVAAKGSHMQYTHPSKPGRVTMTGGEKLTREVSPGTLNSILYSEASWIKVREQ